MKQPHTADARSSAGASSEQRAMDLGDLASTQQMGLVGPDYWTYAKLKDWILLNPEIPHVEVRVYGILRSLVTRWLNDQRVTKDHLRFICPGVNGKPMGERTFDGVLRSLAARKLISVSTGGAVTVRSSATGRFEKSEQVLLRVHELPEEGLEFAGFHTVREAFEAYPGPGWDTDQKDQNSRSHRPQKTAGGGHRAQKSADGRNHPQISAGHAARSELGEHAVSSAQTEESLAQTSAFSAQKSAPLDPLGLQEEGVPNVFPDTDGNSVRPFRTARASAASAGITPDGRTDDLPRTEGPDRSPSTPVTDPAAGVPTAAKLVAAEAIQADLRRIDLLPALRQHQRQQLTRLHNEVAGALLRFPEAKVARYLEEKAAAANTVKWLLAAFTDYGDTIGEVQVPSLDEARDGEVLRAAAVAASSSTPTRPALPEVRAVPEPDLTSPVPWLTDTQFAALSHQDRAHVRVAADTPVEQLRPQAAIRVRAIRRAAEQVPA